MSTTNPSRRDLLTVASQRLRGAHRFAGPAVSALMAATLAGCATVRLQLP